MSVSCNNCHTPNVISSDCKYCKKEFCDECANFEKNGEYVSTTPTCPHCHKFQYGTGPGPKKGWFF